MTDLSGYHVEQTFEGLSLGDESIDRAEYERCTFRRCRFDGTRFDDVRFVDCTLEDCDLVGVKVPNTLFADVRFQGGRAMGVDFTTLRSLTIRVSFQDVRMDYCNFSGLRLRNLVFRDCGLREATFDNCDLQGASFPGCDLTDAVLRQADLRDTDLRDTRGAFFDPRTCRLKGTKVDPETAVLVLGTLGIESPGLMDLLGLSE